MVEEGGKALAAYLKPREEGRIEGEYTEFVDVVKTLGHVAEYWLKDPQRAVELQFGLGRSYLDLWAGAVKRMAGEKPEPVAEPSPKDKRFADPEWSSNQFFDFLKQAYLLTVKWADHLVKDAQGLDPMTQQKAEFYVRQIVNAIAPSNFVLTNPELLRETLASNAENLARGMHMLAEDIAAGGGDLRIRQSNTDSFEVGRDLAITPGKVIFQNDLIQLIQYTPTTESVLQRPILIVPPWINKFYVLDLTPDRSFIKWCVERGLTVFCISWVNPGSNLASKSFQDYMLEGPLAALDVIEQVTGETKVNAIGYCVGGTLLAATLAYLAADRDQRIVSATFFASQVDFTYSGDLKVFADEEQIAALERQMAERGYLDSPKMANRLQPAALERSDLAVCDQQLLQGQGAVAVRPALLEFRRDPHAGGEPFVLPAQLLSREQAGARRDGHRRREARSQVDQDPGLQSGDARGPHRAGEIGVARLPRFRRPGEVRARRLRPHRRRGQSAGVEQVPVLDRRQAARRRSRHLARRRERASGLVVAGLARLAQGAGATTKSRRVFRAAARSPIEDAPGSYVKVRGC